MKCKFKRGHYNHGNNTANQLGNNCVRVLQLVIEILTTPAESACFQVITHVRKQGPGSRITAKSASGVPGNP